MSDQPMRRNRPLSGAELIDAARPEDRLLIACAWVGPEAEQRERVASLAGQASDWDYLVSASLRHSVMPLVCCHLFELPAGFVPPAVLGRLEKLFYANVARNAVLTRKMFEILDLLRGEGIRLLPFKGPVIAMALYGDPSLRRFDDLDFLVHRDDIVRARQILIAQGFTPHLDMSPAESRAHLHTGWEVIFMKPGEEYSVELDTGIAPRHFSFAIGIDRLWQGYESVTLEGREVRTLSAENLILILCAHGTKHLWSKLIWISDIARLALKHTDLDWNRVLVRARGLGAERMLLLALQLVEDVLGLPPPENLARLARPDEAARGLSAETVRRLLDAGQAPVRRFEKLGFHLRARERLRDRAAYVTRLALTPSYADWKALPLPGLLFPLYYLTRPFRLAGKLIRIAAGRRADTGQRPVPRRWIGSE